MSSAKLFSLLLKFFQTAVEEISQSLRQSTLRPVLALDMKVVNLGGPAGGQEFLSVVVLGAPNRKLYVFDVAHSDTIVLESGLKELLQKNGNCVKVSGRVLVKFFWAKHCFVSM